MSYVVVALIWNLLYDPLNGPINGLLEALSLGPVNFLTDSHLAMPSIIAMSIWRNLGYFMIILLAGIQSVSTEMLEAAQMDGAGAVQRFFHITIPQLSNTLLFVVVTWFLGGLQMFTQSYVMTDGGSRQRHPHAGVPDVRRRVQGRQHRRGDRDLGDDVLRRRGGSISPARCRTCAPPGWREHDIKVDLAPGREGARSPGGRSPQGPAQAKDLHRSRPRAGALYVVPMAFVLLVSLTPDGMPTDGTLPSALAPGNYVRAIASTDFLLYLSNSLLISVVAVITQVLLSTSAGYALAKLPLPGKSWMLLLIIALLVIPPEVVLVPLFLIMLHVPFAGGNDVWGSGGYGLLDSYTGMIIPHVIGALGIFLMRQFYAGLRTTRRLRTRGQPPGRIFARIYTPLTIPAVTVAVLAQGRGTTSRPPHHRSDSMQPLQLG